MKEFHNKMDKYQIRYYDSLMNTPVTCCNAKAGSGKTTIAVLAGLELLKSGSVDKIIYLRFPDQMLQSLGAVPGELEEKEIYYMEPFIEACAEFGVIQHELERLKNMEQIVMCTNIALRGANIKNSFFIIDEAQNGSFKDLKLVLTRINETCRTALIGHAGQCDNKRFVKEDAFREYIKHLVKKPFAKETPLKINHRSEISDWADRLMMTNDGKYYIDRD